MPITEKIIYVYDHFSFDEPKLLGKLFVNTIKKEDLLELWKRIVFNMSVSNTDDHLRNHAFILKRNGWVLSPLYDVNPVPYGDELSLNINENDNRISIPLAMTK